MTIYIGSRISYFASPRGSLRLWYVSFPAAAWLEWYFGLGTSSRASLKAIAVQAHNLKEIGTFLFNNINKQ